ncbi:MAG TPA: acetate/propionate family kinase [Hyphomicrobiales bacterium]|nr:acetate/propionate family kinase [Hyphomicrobiales bacterium]
MPDAVLALNAGSSSLKFALFEAAADGPKCILSGKIDGIGREGGPHAVARNAAGEVRWEKRWPAARELDQDAMLGPVLDFVASHLGEEGLAAIGHRIVHGGTNFVAPALLDAGTMAKLDALCPLAPLHQPHNLAAVKAVAAMRPGLPQVGCFDTAFHAGQDATVTRIALPRDLAEEAGLRRYGFHGLSYDYIAGRLRELDAAAGTSRVIVAHLGAGASLCALRDGNSVETTMGFSVLDGLVMATRPGALDPGVVLYLAREKGMAVADIEDMLYHRSGLLGVSGITGDMKALLASGEPHAKEAIDLYVWRIARESAALAGTLGGLDAFVFTAGVGENAPSIRRAVAARLAWLGVALDEAANAAGRLCISQPSSRVSVWAIPTDEELVIARGTLACLARQAA